MTAAAQARLARTDEDGVAILTIDHPPANTLTPELLGELEAAFDLVAGDAAVRAVVVTGAGRIFVAGADVRVLAAIPSSREGAELARSGQALLEKIEAGDKPVIAAINGACLGGGLELALSCHVRLAVEGARLGQPEINLGLIPGLGGTQRLTQLVGRSRATELILTGDPISAEEAKAIGLVSRVVPPEDLLRHAVGLARRIAAKSRTAVRAALQAIHDGTRLGLTEGLRREAELFGSLCDSEDMREGVTAFLEKRQPRFKDR